jgi:hypothetical protein
VIGHWHESLNSAGIVLNFLWLGLSCLRFKRELKKKVDK